MMAMPPRMMIPILMYHEIAPSDKVADVCRQMRLPQCVSADDFEFQASLLRDNDFSCTTPDCLPLMRDHRNQRQISLTFDDGYAGNIKYALPVLQRYGLKATFYLTTGWLEKPGMLQWDEAAELAKQGMEIGSHTATHAKLSRLPYDQALKELAESKQTLEDRLNCRVTSLSLPGGDIPAYLTSIAQQAGYKSVVTVRFGCANDKTDVYRLPRIAIERDCTPDLFQKIIAADRRYILNTKLKKILLPLRLLATGQQKSLIQGVLRRLRGC